MRVRVVIITPMHPPAIVQPDTRAASEYDPTAPDKAAHFAVSYGLTLTGTLLLEKLDVPRWQAVLISGGATFALGLAKEILVDAEASGGDLAADALGVGIAAGMTFVFRF
jgi:hypothetical protein